MERQTVRISVRVRSGAASFRVGIQALSISEALALAGSRYPHGEVRGLEVPLHRRNWHRLFRLLRREGDPAGTERNGHGHQHLRGKHLGVFPPRKVVAQ